MTVAAILATGAAGALATLLIWANETRRRVAGRRSPISLRGWTIIGGATLCAAFWIAAAAFGWRLFR